MKLMTNVEHGTLVHSDWIDSFDDSQKEQIILGDLADLDVTIYGKPCYDAHQMSEIREGLSNEVDAAVYAISAFDDKQMFHIRKALEDGVEYRDFALPCINFEYMKDQVAKRN